MPVALVHKCNTPVSHIERAHTCCRVTRSQDTRSNDAGNDIAREEPCVIRLATGFITRRCYQLFTRLLVAFAAPVRSSAGVYRCANALVFVRCKTTTSVLLTRVEHKFTSGAADAHGRVFC